jgi:hypothetical protein
MTREEAARLEAEAKAAQAKLGKGPPPKPVPDVKKLAAKVEQKEKPKPGARGLRRERGRGPAAPRVGAAAPAPLKMGPGKVAQYLAAKGTPVLFKGVGMLRRLRQNEQTHDGAAEKLKQSENAVVIPPSEGQSKSNAGQVNAISSRPTPAADVNRAKQKLQASLTDNTPRSIEDVDNFKRDKKAQHTGADVMKVVQGDKNAVLATFADMGQTPAPTPSDHTPEALPPEEVAPPTAAMNLGQRAIAPLQKEHTDLSHYTQEADSKLKEEGVTQEQLDMVDSGDLAAANREKKGMETTAKAGPLAVQKFALEETSRVDRELKQEEKKERDGLKAKRKANLGATTQKQKGAKGALEKKREEVAAKINGTFTAAQEKVKKKLADLETQSMKRFDDGNADATKAFEDHLNNELDAYKKDRYSGWFGWARKAKDWLLGMDELPGVKAIFERNRSAFVTTINRLGEDITADNKRVIQECKDELAKAKQAIKEYVDKLGPDLKDIGKRAAEEMNAKLDELDRFVAKQEQELQDKLKDKQQAAIKAIDEKIEKMKEAMAGALAKLGKLLLWAAKKFFTWALEKFGLSLSTIEGIISKGVAVLKAIFTQPIRFVKNLVGAASTGFQNFGKNFLKHLQDAVFEWLTGALEGVTLPQSWDLRGILSVIFQILGLTYQNIRSHLVKLIPEPAVKTLETTFTLVRTLVTDGPMAAWEQLKEVAGEMKQGFIGAVKDWIKWKVVEEAIKTILAMFIPGAGILRAIIGIYDTIVFFIQRAKDIMQMIGNFLGSIAEIAAGNIGAAATALENGLARGLKLVIDFLARFLRLTGITKRIQEAIQKIRAKVDAAIEKVAQWVVAQARRLGAVAAAGAQRVAGAAQQAWQRLTGVGEVLTFAAGGEQHRLWVERRGRTAAVVVASAKTDLIDFLRSPDLVRITAEIPHLAEVRRRAAEILSAMQPDVEQVARWIEQAQPSARETAQEQEIRLKNEGVHAKERALILLLRELFEALAERSTRAEATLRIRLDLTRVKDQMAYARGQMALSQNAALREHEAAVERISRANQALLSDMTARPGRYKTVREQFARDVEPAVARLPSRLLKPPEAEVSAAVPSAEDWRTGPLYAITYAETRRPLRLIENPADRFPRAVQDILNRAQQTLSEANKPGAAHGDGSSAYAAIEEQVRGSNALSKFNAPAATLPGLAELHEAKCQTNNTGFERFVADITSLMQNDPQKRSGRVVSILRAEIAKNLQAIDWCQQYRGGRYPDLPAWAAAYRDGLRALGLKERGETW